MFFKKWWKRKKHTEEELQIADISVLDTEKKEKSSGSIIDDKKPKKTEGNAYDGELKELREKLKELEAWLNEQEQPTYENYLSSKLYVSKEVLEKVVEQITEYAEEIEKKLVRFDCDNYVRKLNDCLKDMEVMEKSVRSFLEEDKVLREEITKYTEVVNRINEKKLQGAEFKAVKEKLEPSLNAIKERRSEFLLKEERINGEVAGLKEKVVELIETYLKNEEKEKLD